MNDQNEQTEIKTPFKADRRPGFNLALFLGLCVVALSIFLAGSNIANNIPQSLHGHFSGNFSGSFADSSSNQEFMSEWLAASFLGLSPDEFAALIDSGELSGTYAVFQVERMIFRPWDGSERAFTSPGIAEAPVRIEYDTVLMYHRIFSRERLSQWLLERMNHNIDA